MSDFNLDEYMKDAPAYDPNAKKQSGKYNDTIEDLMKDAPPQARGIGGFLKDGGKSIGIGLNEAVRGAIGFNDLVRGTHLNQNLEKLGADFKGNADAIRETKSDISKQKNKEWDEQKGFWNKLGYSATHLDTAVEKGVESLPAMVLGGIQSNFLGNAVKGVTRGAVGEGMQQAGSSYADADAKAGGATEADKIAAIGSGAGDALISRLSAGLVNGKIGKKLGLADIDTAIANRLGGEAAQMATKPVGIGGYAKAIGSSMATEGILEEMPQSAQEKAWQNYADGRPLMEGVPEAAAEGAVLGGIMGGGFTASRGFTGKQPTPTSDTLQIPYTPTSTPDSQTAVAERIDPNLPQLGYNPVQPTPQIPYQPTSDIITVDENGVAFTDQATNDYLQGRQAQDRAERDASQPQDINDVTPVPSEANGFNADIPNALPAPSNDFVVGEDGTAYTRQDQNQQIQDERQANVDKFFARLRGDTVNDITPVPTEATGFGIESEQTSPQKPSEQLGLDPSQGGLSSAATVAVDTGASPITAHLQSNAQSINSPLSQAGQIATQDFGNESGQLGSTEQTPQPITKTQVADLWNSQAPEQRKAILDNIYGDDAKSMAHMEKAFDALPIPAKRQIQNMAQQSVTAQAQQAQSQGQTPKATPKLYGNESYIQNGNERQPTRVAVVEADSLTPDDKNTDNQYRDRTRVASQAQIDSIANNLDPRQLTDTTTMATGSPTLANDGKTIIAGNGRTKAIQQAYAQGKGDEYKQSLIEQAQSLGIDPQQVAGMKNPVLVKEFVNPVDTKKMAIASNENAGLAMSAKEQARADSERLPDISTLASDERGNINLAKNAPIFRQFIQSIPVEARASMMTSDGMLSQEGLKRLQNAVLYKAYGNSNAFNDMVENTDVDVKNAINGLTQTAPKIAQTKEGIAQGVVHNADISDEITNALSMLQQIRKNGMSVSDYLAQLGLFEDNLSPIAKELVQYLDENIRSAKAVTDLITTYYDNLDKLGNPNQADIFGNGQTADKQQLFNQALEQVKNARQPNKSTGDLFSQSSEQSATEPTAEQPSGKSSSQATHEPVRADQSEGNGASVGTDQGEVRYSQMSVSQEPIKLKRGDVAVKPELLKDGKKFIDFSWGLKKLSQFINSNPALEQYPELGEINIESAGFFNPLRFDETTNTLFVPSGMDNKAFEQQVLALLKDKLIALQKDIKPAKTKTVVDTSNDKEYMELAKRYQDGDMSVEPRLRQLINQQATANGFDSDVSFRMSHTAPVNDGFNDSADDLSNMFGEDIYSSNALHYFGMGDEYVKADRESLQAINNARGKPDRLITVYRAMPKDVKGTSIGNGDWVTTSKEYVKEHGHHALNGEYKIVSRLIPAKQLFNNGDSIHEWGIDTGEDLLRSKVHDREKLNDLVTYDDKGKIIPLSKRFNASKKDVRYSESQGQKGTTKEQVIQTLSDKFGKSTIDKLINDGVLEIIDYAEALRRNPKTPPKADGYYVNGKATLIADNLDPNMIIPTFLHELGGHGGLQTLMSDKAYNSLMREFDAMVSRGDKLATDAYNLANAVSQSKAEAQDEYLPYLISLASRQQGNSKIKSLLNRIVLAVKSFIREKFGVSLKVTPNDIVALAEKMVGEWANQAVTINNAVPQFSQSASVVDDIAKQAKVLQGEAIAIIDESTLNMPKLGGFSAIEQWATDLFKQQGGKAINPTLGEITLNHRSVKDSLAHGKFSPYKNIAFASVKDVLEKGTLIANDINEFKEQSYYISAPVLLNGRENIVTVTVHKDSNSQRMYLHGVMIKEGLLKPRVSATLEKKSRTHYGSLTSADIHNILHDLLTVNTQPTNNDIRYSQMGGMAQSQTANNLSSTIRSWISNAFAGRNWNGRLSKWHDTVGTMYNLAERNPLFKPVYENAEKFINDVSLYASRASEYAPKLLPKLDGLRDLMKTAVNAKDNEAIAKPIFEGTLSWYRDPATKKPVQTNDVDKAGIVWTADELRSMFGLNDEQIGLYREFRDTTNNSLRDMAKAEMLRILGKDGYAIHDAVMQADFDDAVSQVERHIQGMIASNPAKATSLQQDLATIQDKADKVKHLIAKGYAPLSRFGKYTVDVVNPADGKREYFEMFETAKEANLKAIQLRTQYQGMAVTTGVMSQQDFQLYSGVTPETAELFGEILGLDPTSTDPKDIAFQEYLRNAKNNRSALKRLIHRQGIAGFSQDVGRVLASFVYSNARLTSSMLNMAKIDEAIANIPKEQGELKDVAVRLADYIKNPQEEGQAIRGFLFAQYLGGSIASAMVNLSQPFMVTMPWLSQYGGAVSASQQMAKALKDWEYWSKGTNNFEPALKQALKKAEEDGVISPQEVFALMKQAQGKKSLMGDDGTKLGWLKARANNGLAKGGVLWGSLFSYAEQINRRLTYVAAYRTAVEQGMNDPDGFARRAIRETQFVYNKANKMRWGRGAVGGTLMTFKTYTISYLELMSRMWGNGAEGKKAVGFMLLMMFAIGGAGGLPFAEDMQDIINAIAQLFGYNINSGDKLHDMVERHTSKMFADYMANGVLNWLPADVSGRLGMGNILPATGLLLNKADHSRDIAELAGPAGDFVTRMAGMSKGVAQGTANILQGDVADGLGNIGGGLKLAAPKAVSNALQGIDMAVTGQYRDKKGAKIEDTDMLDASLKAIGFQPTKVARVQSANWDNQSLVATQEKRASDIRQLWAEGIYEHDSRKVAKARRMLAEWNEKNPDQTIKINIANVNRKARQMALTKAERIINATPKSMKEQVRANYLEY